MDNIITNLKDIRINFNVTQEQVAKYLWINRVSYNNLESWKRKLKEFELHKISELFEIGIDEIKWEKSNKVICMNKNDKLYKFKQVLLYILNKCWQKPNIWKTVLNKLLYFSDFNYYEFAWNSITGQLYSKKPRWPVPNDIDIALESMKIEWYISELCSDYYWFNQIRYIPNIKPDLSIFNWNEITIIEQVIENFSDKSATWISDYSHEDIPYKSTENIWDEISYGLVFYRTKEYIANPANYE